MLLIYVLSFFYLSGVSSRFFFVTDITDLGAKETRVVHISCQEKLKALSWDGDQNKK